MTNAYISGTGFYVPPRVVTNDDLVREYNMETSDEWIQQRTGIRERRFAADGVGSADLGVEASKMALEAAGVDPWDLDMIVFATLSPEHCFPGSGVYMQEKLGLCAGPKLAYVPCLDIRNQCSGFLYGTKVASALIQSGQCRRVLLVGAETHSHALDLSTRGRTVASLFGDGAGAAVFEATDEDKGVRGVWLGADGSNADVLAQHIWDIRKSPFVELDDEGYGHVPPLTLFAQMDGKTVFKHAVTKLAGALMQALGETKTEIEDIDLFVLHQANKRINEYVANKLLKVPEHKVVHNIERYGNTTAATIPILLAESVRDGTLKPGMKIALAAFGSGFTWGSAILDW
ncbi:3-oxoacyl-[acyl-carrier-protein] synthase 3 protein 1 [Enhygromyxa salina]|uniref:3-oxoacyl-[acyl-carrier-protein] synthase 3 protein 1 n=1 Tax=Enhygromyxa salina TaxID=215803 RepID=A0A2S9XX80_9BACT|nr:beta-ketoacyl-ACP synthase III [Enhygromyxa salina]PRP97487.1 3-oxoacyl-[acyl-carrier-protein] synthase 3 protein 1 [Enhygromyxa salina]